MDTLHEEIDKCREELPILKRINLQAASVPTFDWFNWRPCCAMIEMETRLAQFQIIFKTLNLL
jgi:hypothetical protein